MKKITGFIYQTEDGQVFISEQSAKNHEIELDVNKIYKELFKEEEKTRLQHYHINTYFEDSNKYEHQYIRQRKETIRRFLKTFGPASIKD